MGTHLVKGEKVQAYKLTFLEKANMEMFLLSLATQRYHDCWFDAEVKDRNWMSRV